ncbi:hypothetical protein BD413DRAFT_186510 [Trametes elegans]|nr:hypothetical protein BD413DRAFT_186510 [Trametes elegans]
MCVRRPASATLLSRIRPLSLSASRARAGPWSPSPLTMLGVHPNSVCDVCLDSYTVEREPKVIPCGHVFCEKCLSLLRHPYCPLCRTPFHTLDVRRLHVDQTTLLPKTPHVTTTALDSGERARQFQTKLTLMIRGGATATDLYEVQSELKPWLSTQGPNEHADLRATYTLLYSFVLGKQRTAAVEQQCSDLEAQLEEERRVATMKYDELEKMHFDEREVLLAKEQSLKDDNARLAAERDELKAKYEDCSAECRRLSDELDQLKANTLLPHPTETRQYYIHEVSSATVEPYAALKDTSDSVNAVKVQIVGKDNVFQLSPVPPTQPIPDLPSSLMTFQPLTDDLDEAADDDATQRSHRIASSRAIPILPRSESYRSRNQASGLNLSDPDAMSISVPRSTLDVHMASVSSSPNVSTIQYASRPVEFVSNSVGRVPENALGLRTAEPVSHGEHDHHQQRLATLRDVLSDPTSPSSSLSRKSTLSDVSERSRPVMPSGISSTRTPSPVSSASHSYPSSMDKEYVTTSHRQQPVISSASAAALEHQQRTRASSTASATTGAPSPLPHALRDRDPAPPIHAIYAPAPPPMPSPGRPIQGRRQTPDTASISKGKASSMGIASTGAYQSGLTRSLQRAMQDAPRVS